MWLILKLNNIKTSNILKKLTGMKTIQKQNKFLFLLPSLAKL